jgi:hypothetical protein
VLKITAPQRDGGLGQTGGVSREERGREQDEVADKAEECDRHTGYFGVLRALNRPAPAGRTDDRGAGFARPDEVAGHGRAGNRQHGRGQAKSPVGHEASVASIAG